MLLFDHASSFFSRSIEPNEGFLEHAEALIAPLLLSPFSTPIVVPHKMQEILKAMKGTVGILPLFKGRIDPAFLLSTERAISHVFGMSIRILRPIDPKTCGLEGEYIDGDWAISFLSFQRTSSFYSCLLVVTDLPIFVEKHNWVHGYAGLRIPVGLVSSARIPQDGSSSRSIFKVVVHEVAHMFELPHCTNRWCIMHQSLGYTDSSRVPTFCEICLGRIMATSEFRLLDAIPRAPIAVP